MQAYRILLVGCGQLGSRHLQALSSLLEVGEIFVVDPRLEALALGKERFSEIVGQNPNASLRWSTTLPPEAKGGELCIVATQAKGRCALVKEIAEKLGYKKFLIEKIVAQSVEEYKDLMRFCAERGVQVWVNCKTRAYGIHQYIKSKLIPHVPFVFSDIGGNHGLANNGVHSADLFTFYDQASSITLVGAHIDDVLLPSKRGKEVFDLSGTLYGHTIRGSDFILSYTKQHESPNHISIVSSHGRFIIDHFQKFAYESYPETSWKWTSIPIDENWAVSHMTKAFVSDILEKGTCLLPTIKECFPAHQFILDTLLPHFNRLRGTNDTFCPVT